MQVAKETTGEVEKMKKKIKDLEADQKLLMEEYEERQKMKDEIKKIRRIHETRVFYDTVRLKLAEIFLASKVYILFLFLFSYYFFFCRKYFYINLLILGY